METARCGPLLSIIAELYADGTQTHPQMQARHQNGAARRGSRLCAAALDTAGSIPTSLSDDPFLFEVEPSKAEDPRGGKTLAVALAKLAWETKSESVRVLHVAKQSSICRCSSSFLVLQ